MAKIILDVQLKNTLATEQLKQLETSIKSVADSLSGVKVNKDLTAQINSLTKYYNSLAKVAQKTLQTNNKNAIAEQKLAQQKAKTATAITKQLDAENKEFASKIKATKAVEDYTKTQTKSTQAVKENTKAIQDNQQGMLSMMQGFLRWQVVATLVMQPLNLIKSAFQSINETLVETEDRIVELQRVLPSGSIGNKDLSDKLYKLAADYGQTFENVSQIALNFARSGMNTADTLKATEAAVIALNVAELDATQASDGLIAIMQQFGLEASDLLLIVDKLNITADNAAVTTDRLLTALQRTGSSAKNANLSLDETVSIITALSEATGRSGENLGTAVNSLIQFSTKSSALDTFAKLSENMANIVENFRHGQGTVLDIWQGLSKEISGTNSDSEGILSGLFGDSDWRDLNEELQDALGENYAKVTEIYDTASTFRKNYFIALLNNMDSVQAAQDKLSSAEGYSQKENEEYLDTYSAKLNILKAEWQAIANDEQGILGLKKHLVELATTLLRFIESIGGIKTLLVSISTVVLALTKNKISAGLSKIILHFSKLAREVRSTVTPSLNTLSLKISELKLKLKSLGTEEEKLAVKTELLSAKQQKLSMVLSTVGNIVTVALAVSTVIFGIYNHITQKAEEEKRRAEEAREETLSAYESIKEKGDKFAQLSTRYNELSNIQDRTAEQDTKYYELQKEIVSQLGDRAKALRGLTEGTEEYNNKLKELASQELISLSVQSQDAADIYASKINEDTMSSGEVFLFGGSVLGDSDRQIQNAWNSNAADRIDYLRKAAKQAFLNGDDVMSDYITKTADKIQESLDNFIEAQVKALAYKALAGDGVSSEKEYDSLLYDIMQAVASTGIEQNAVKDILDSILQSGGSSYNPGSRWVDDLSKVAGKYEDIYETLKKIRDTQKETSDYEEKRLSVLEAEKALTDAQNQRNVRVFNAETGNWEWQRNEQAVENAQKNLDKAKESVADAAWNEAMGLFKEGNLTNDTLLEVLNKWAEAYNGTFGTGETPKFVDEIIDAIEETGRVHIRPTGGDSSDGATDDNTSGSSSSSTMTGGGGSGARTEKAFATYDSGGVLQGLGGIKATARDEIVLPPALAEKILNPTSNAQFKAFADSLGLLFGASDRSPVLSKGDVITNGGSAVDNSNNNSYVVNGVPISVEDAHTKTIVQLFENMSLLN